MMEHEPYQFRGNRVPPKTMNQITEQAKGFCRNFELKKYLKLKRIDKPLEALSGYGITIDIKDEMQWLNETYGLTSGHFDPNTFTISLPEHTYKLACAGDREALFIVMHEIGHLILGHRPLLHSSRKPPTYQEDSEWQADTFSEVIIHALGFKTEQLTFEFL